MRNRAQNLRICGGALASHEQQRIDSADHTSQFCDGPFISRWLASAIAKLNMFEHKVQAGIWSPREEHLEELRSREELDDFAVWIHEVIQKQK